jgi:SAM-dependent methyltransferase
MSNKTNSDFDYEGMDLEAMAFADNYYDWLLSIIRPYIGDKVVEVGAGVGSFSKLIIKTGAKDVVLVEPSKSMHSLLDTNINELEITGQRVTTYNNYLHGLGKIIKNMKPDTFIYVNVFEHIKYDVSEIEEVAKYVGGGGHVIIFVPALQGLYSDLDKSIDHYRRYDKRSLRKLCEGAGLEVVHLRYMDMIGILPWWFSFVVMKRTKLVPVLVRIYDGLCIPIIRVIETLIRPPVGKNLIIVAKKKA